MGFGQCHETYPYLILSHVCTHIYSLVDRRYHCICILLVIICNKPSSQKPLTNQQGYQQLFPHVSPIQIAMYGMLIPFYLRLSSFFPQRMCITSGFTTFSNIAHIVYDIYLTNYSCQSLSISSGFTNCLPGHCAGVQKDLYDCMGLVNKWVCLKNKVTLSISCKNICSRIQKLLLCNYPAINSQTHTSHLVAYISAMSQ